MTLLLAGIIASFMVQEQATSRSYTVREVIELAVARGLENDDLKKDNFSFKKQERKEKLDKNGNVKEVKETAIFHVFTQNDQVVEQLIEKDGKVIENGEIEAGLSNPHDINFNEILLGKYEFEISNKIPLYWQNRLNIYVIDFYPKEDLENDTLTDHLLNKLEGTLYLDKEFNTVAIYAEFPDDKELSVAWGLLGKLHSFQCTMKQKKIDDVMVMDSIEVVVKYRKVFWTTHEKITRTYLDYERIEPQE